MTAVVDTACLRIALAAIRMFAVTRFEPLDRMDTSSVFSHRVTLQIDREAFRLKKVFVHSPACLYVIS
jgi:hypothetical protein